MPPNRRYLLGCHDLVKVVFHTIEFKQLDSIHTLFQLNDDGAISHLRCPDTCVTSVLCYPILCLLNALVYSDFILADSNREAATFGAGERVADKTLD